MSKEKSTADERERDIVSDPANDTDEGQDWTAEGGATGQGPATNVAEEATRKSESSSG